MAIKEILEQLNEQKLGEQGDDKELDKIIDLTQIYLKKKANDMENKDKKDLINFIGFLKKQKLAESKKEVKRKLVEYDVNDEKLKSVDELVRRITNVAWKRVTNVKKMEISGYDSDSTHIGFYCGYYRPGDKAGWPSQALYVLYNKNNEFDVIGNAKLKGIYNSIVKEKNVDKIMGKSEYQFANQLAEFVNKIFGVWGETEDLKKYFDSKEPNRSLF